MQLHGGMGMPEQLDFGLFMKRARVLQELWGDTARHIDRLARLRGYRAALPGGLGHPTTLSRSRRMPRRQRSSSWALCWNKPGTSAPRAP